MSEQQSLKSKTLKGTVWSAIDSFSSQAIQFVLGILLARILAPSDYGVIGMLAIFLAVSQSIIDSGFGNALIQKKDRNQIDYSTVFYFNIIIGVIIYIILFVAAPLIASFYNMPILTNVTRVLALNLIVNSLMIVQNTKLTIELNFKILTKIRFCSNLISGFIALSLAYLGYGVWALVFQSVIAQLLSCLFLWIFAKWKPSLCFSKASFLSLFSFGSKLLITGLYGPIFNNLNTLIIGKFFTANALGFYTRAYHFAQFPSFNISQIISRVSYPVLSSIQDDNQKLCHGYRLLIKNTYFVVFPCMLGLACMAEPIILLLLTDKWIGCVSLLQILCISLVFYPLISYNINLLLVKGQSGLHLKLDFIKKIFSIIILIVSIKFGIKGICYGMVITTLFSWLITAFYSGKLIGLTLTKQLNDLLPSFICSIIMVSAIFPISLISLSVYFVIPLQILMGIVIYTISSSFLNKECLKTIKSMKYDAIK